MPGRSEDDAGFDFDAGSRGESWEGMERSERYAACLLAARAGNRKALETLVADLTPLVWHVARAGGLTTQDAEDVAQTVWLTLFAHLHRLTEPKALAAWLITTTRRETRRRRQRDVPLPDEFAASLVATGQQPEGEALRRDRDERLWRAFHLLSDRCRRLLRLTVLAGRVEYGPVAEAMGMPRGGIGPTRSRCLKSLRDSLTDITD